MNVDLTKLSPKELILLAIKDAKKSLKQGYTIDMTSWGEGPLASDPTTCSVCFAGAVMLQEKDKDCVNTHGSSMTLNLNIYEGGQNSNVYYALDALRVGKLYEFCEFLDIPLPKVHMRGRSFNNEDVTFYNVELTHIPNFKEFDKCETPKEFFKQLKKIAKLFK